MLLLLAHLAMADPVVDLAPSIGDVRAQLDALGGRVDDADALAEAVTRSHNAWAERTGRPGRTVPCDDPAAPLAARAAVFGEPWRDAVQLARVSLLAVEGAVQAPTAAPLVDDGDQGRLVALRSRVKWHERALAEASAWHAQHIGGFVRRCAPGLRAGPVLERQLPPARGEERARPVAIAVVGELQVCTADGVVEGAAVLVLERALACYGPCTCEPEPVAPAAVLGDTNEP